MRFTVAHRYAEMMNESADFVYDSDYHRFVQSLKKPPQLRTLQDTQVIHAHLRGFEALCHLRDTALRELAKTIGYDQREANDILYCRGELSICWYVLLSGSVFIDGSMFLPRNSFGKRSAGSGRRANECLILERSEMLVIDYPDVHLMRPGHRLSTPESITHQHSDLDIQNNHVLRKLSTGEIQILAPVNSTAQHHGSTVVHVVGNRSSHGSDTSSAYSGSDTMQSVQSSLDDQEVDLSGLVESVVDSDDEEDLAESIDSLTVRDAVRECLEKFPQDRTEDDIETLLDFVQHLMAFSNMTLAVRRSLCAVMVFAVVEKSRTVVMNDGEELDSWSVIVNGHVEIEHSDGRAEELHLGDSFGITATMDKMYHRGTMRTKVDDCQFVCIAQGEYYRILHQGEENTRKHEENGVVVMVTEHRVMDAGNRKGYIVIKGTNEMLLSQLMEEHSIIDPTYIEDFLLTHRVFLDSSVLVANKLLRWFNDPNLRDKVTRVLLLWVNNHFTDFETDSSMMECLEQFELSLEKEKMQGQMRLLSIACAAKARSRTVTLARSTRDEVLHFSILGGYDRGFGIFVSKVEKGSKADDVGLKRGDQILEVNGQSFSHVNHAKALEILRGSTHLSITVKNNLLAFREMLTTPENTSPKRNNAKRNASDIARMQGDPRARLSTHFEFGRTPGEHSYVPSVGVLCPAGARVVPSMNPAGTLIDCSPNKMIGQGDKKGFMTLGHNKTRIKKALMKMNIIPKNLIGESHLNSSDDNVSSSQSASSLFPVHPHYHHRHHSHGTIHEANCVNVHPLPATGTVGVQSMYHSHSNPDLTTLHPYYDPFDHRPDYPEHVLKVYKSDQTCKYLLVHKETTAREVVMLALREFGITEPSSNYSLCEVSVGENSVIKRRRLPDQLQNLAERIGLSSRYYLKNNTSTEIAVPDELAGELSREMLVHFLQLNSMELAILLTYEDSNIFRQIEPTEYVDDLFEIKSNYGTPMVTQFAQLVNKEMFWVVTEICNEHNSVRRMKIIKQFIKIARHCKDYKNFNSMFAVVSGLGHGAVSRLRQTWDKLPSKYQRLLSDMQDLMDPSRNMSKYRNLINSDNTQPPMIPFYPVVRKDLTFIHLGNDTKVAGLVNFEKLRMIAKEIRSLANMCSAPYDLFTMLELGGAHPSQAMVSLNQLTMAGIPTLHKRRKKSTAMPNPKKMFEEAQMVRRVKAYLSRMKIITDEEQLHRMSVECEPMAAPSTSSAISIGQNSHRSRRQPSPTLSTASSASSNSEGKKSLGSIPKFGSDSPQAVRKLLALSDQSKVRPHHPMLPNTFKSQHSLSPSPSPSNVRRVGGATVSGPKMGTSLPGIGTLPYLGGQVVHPSTALGLGGLNGAVYRCHGRSSSDTSTTSTNSNASKPNSAVDLNAESSSVTTMNNVVHRKRSDGSITNGILMTGEGNYCYDTDSSSISSANSPPTHPRRTTTYAGTLCGGDGINRQPALNPHFKQELQAALQRRLAGQNNPMAPVLQKGKSTDLLLSTNHRSRLQPTEFQQMQMGRQKQMAAGGRSTVGGTNMHRLNRAHSHEGVSSSLASLMNHPLPGRGAGGGNVFQNAEIDDDDSEAQISAV